MSSCIWPCFGKWPVSCLLDENRCTEDSSLILVCSLWTVSCWEIWVLKPRKFASSVGPNVNARACNLHTQCHKKEAKAKGRCMTLCDIYHIILSRVGADLFNFCLNLINAKIKNDKNLLRKCANCKKWIRLCPNIAFPCLNQWGSPFHVLTMNDDDGNNTMKMMVMIW